MKTKRTKTKYVQPKVDLRYKKKPSKGETLINIHLSKKKKSCK